MIEVLAITDLAIACLCVPVIAMSAYHGKFIFEDWGVLCYGFVMTYLCLCNIHLLVAIAIERYISIVHPLRKLTTSSRKTYLFLTTSTTLPLLWALAPLLGWNYYRLEDHLVSVTMNWIAGSPAETAYIISMFIFCFIIPLTIIVFCYWKIIAEVSTVRT